MLASITIRNVVLIDQLTIEFSKGFCALTGETGAGKSILLDSLGLALGARADSGLVRKGEDEAAVTAMFEVPAKHPAYTILRDADITVETGEALILRRALGSDGRSRAFINDQPVSIGLLKQIGELLVEIHGQFDTQGLLDPKTHRGLLDDYAGTGDATIRLWNEWQQAQDAQDAAREKMNRARAEETYLRQALEDLDDLDPKTGEEEELAALRERLMRREQVLENLGGADAALSDAESALNGGYRMLERTGEEAAPLLEALDRALAEIQEASSQIQSQVADLEESDHSLTTIDDRLFALRGQARKHGCTVDDLPAKRDDLAAQLKLIDNQDDALAALAKKVEQARAAFIDAAQKAHDARLKAAKKLDMLVAKELPPLKLDKARFVTSVEMLEEAEWGPGGFDRVRFLVATNPGSEPGALNKIASGGEMSRFMLALKVVMAEVGAAESLIFDEVDSGIGGATASAVGERLARLAQKRQILVVTHSPQVAARAAHHWIVMKQGAKDVKTTVIPLPELTERREEIARMISGAEITGEARAAAEKLLETGT